MEPIIDALKCLWEEIGIESSYINNWGKTSFTDWATALRIMLRKGIVIDPKILAADPQVFVFSADYLPEHISVALTNCKLDHSVTEQSITAIVRDPNGVLPQSEFSTESGNLTFGVDKKTGLAAVEFPLPWGLSQGTNLLELTAEIGGRVYNSGILIVLCPNKAYMHPDILNGRRVAGVSIALYGVRSGSNWGIGDFTDLKKIIDWASEDLNVDFVGLNPLHAIFNRRPYNNSPYTPSSRIYRNFVYLDVTAIPDFQNCHEAVQMVASNQFQEQIRRLRDQEHVQYEEAADLKIKVLRVVFDCFYRMNPAASPQDYSRLHDFEEYYIRHGRLLENFAVFCNLDAHFRSMDPSMENWRQWPLPYRNPFSREVEKFRDENLKDVKFWMYLQWQIDEQLKSAQDHALSKGMAIGLYHDLALAVDSNGADFWGEQELYHTGFSVGAPPDSFALDGQDWGFAPPNSEHVRNSGYKPVLERIEANCGHGGALRIDHVMQVYHLFWIPFGQRPEAGVYVKDNEEDLLNILALQSQLSRTIIIGEDLGTLPCGFRERLMSKGILSYRLFYFERFLDGALVHSYDYPREALVSISTHDLPTLAGFWSGSDLELRKSLGLDEHERYEELRKERTGHKAKIIERLVSDGFLPAQSAHQAWISPAPTDPLHTAVLSYLFDTPAWLAIISQEDIFLDDRQQNLPGTTFQRPNWVTKMRFTVEELKTSDNARRMSQKFNQLVRLSGRTAGE